MSARSNRQPPPGHGYALVALIVIVAVMSVLVAASLPYWSQVIKRDKEAELIFRGLQYAEAIRVFQLRHNRLPNTLDELIEVEPRSIRRLWKDPMTESGEWELVQAQLGGGRATAVATGTAPDGRQSERSDRRGSNRRRGPAPIVGVSSKSKDEAVRAFMGAESYSQWKFTVDLIPTPVAIPDSLLVPRPTSNWIGKPFREGLEPLQGQGPGRDLGGSRRKGDDDE